MRLLLLSDRLRLTESDAAHSARLGSLPGARWNKGLLCWEYPRSPFAAQSIASLAKRKNIPIKMDTEVSELLKQFTTIMDAKKWKADDNLAGPWDYQTQTTPWRHQWRASQFIKPMTAAYLALDMGTGKTMVAINEILRTKAQSTLIICPKSVLDVWASEFSIHVADDAMPDVRILTEPTSKDKAVEAQWHATMAKAREKALVLLVNYESAWRGDLGEWLLKHHWDMVILDECLPAGTQIATHSGQKPIEEVAVGDIVLGVVGDQVVATTVLNTWARDTMAPLVEVGPVKATGNHPIWTQRGYVDASQTVPSDHVRILRRDGPSGPDFEEVLLEELPHQSHVESEAGSPPSTVRANDNPAPRSGSAEEAPCPPGGGDQPIPQSSDCQEGTAGVGSEGVRSSEWREWAAGRSPTVETVLYVGDRLVTGVYFTNRNEASPLQDRHRQSDSQDSGRGGWGRASCEEYYGSRQAQGSFSSQPRVDGDPGAERACDTGCRVFNFETVTGNYFANGLLVHNCHKVKGNSTQVSRWAARLHHSATRRLALSGTPIPNNQLDVFGQFRFLDPALFGSNFTKFKAKYCRMGGYGKYEIVEWLHQDEFKLRMDAITFRVDKSVLDLPSTMSIDRYCTLEPDTEAARVYKDVKNEFVADVQSGTVTAANALTRLLRLQQITSGFVGLEGHKEQWLGDHKLDLLQEVLEGIDPSETVVVFCRFRADLGVVRFLAEKLGRKWGELSGTQNDLVAGQVPENIKVLGVQIQAGGLGVNLVAARFCVFYSVGFSLADYEQAKARVHRGGQTRNVTYVHLIAKHTVDQQVYKALAGKKEVVDEIMEAIKRGDV